jgi:hypothetical protein
MALPALGAGAVLGSRLLPAVARWVIPTAVGMATGYGVQTLNNLINPSPQRQQQQVPPPRLSSGEPLPIPQTGQRNSLLRSEIYGRGGDEAFQTWLYSQPGINPALAMLNPHIRALARQADRLGLEARLEMLRSGEMDPAAAYNRVMQRAFAGGPVFTTSRDIEPLLGALQQRVANDPYLNDPITFAAYHLLLNDPKTLSFILQSEGPLGEARAQSLLSQWNLAQTAVAEPELFGQQQIDPYSPWWVVAERARQAQVPYRRP